jgi:hypothetical protein
MEGGGESEARERERERGTFRHEIRQVHLAAVFKAISEIVLR